MAGDPRFFPRTGPHSIAVLAGEASAHPSAEAPDRLFSGIAPLQLAGPAEVSFLDNKRYLPALLASRAGAVIVAPEMAERVPEGCVALVTPEPYLGWARIAALFHPPAPVNPGIHPTAIVDPAASVDASAEIGPGAIIGAGAEIGARSIIGPGTAIGPGVRVGPDCRIGRLVSIAYAEIGARVTILAGARIGEDGFGFAMTKTGFVDVPQLGRVLIEDDVSIGANSCIDRGSAQDTVIGAGSRLDNLVQIGHNVRLGRCCVIVSQAGISGSTVLDDFVMVGGQAGLTGHLHVGKKVRIGAQSGVMGDVADGIEVVGSPSMPAREFFRQLAVLRKFARGGGLPEQRDRSQGSADTDEKGSG